jgi:glycosyltransferase involved in cell wall biosynthesis/ubiquinone/menaquinone biosynthesis C-methylase UbiE
MDGSFAGTLSVVMPAYNEEATIARTLTRVLASPYVGEVVVVDDASQDQTVEEVCRIGDPRIRLVRQPINLGKGAALRRGFLEVQLQYVIVQDADLEYDPADYQQVLQPLLEGKADVVFGSRFSGGPERRVLLFWHSIGNKFLTLASNALTNLNLSDMETCYKAFRREVIQSIDIEEDRFGFEPEVTAKVARGRWRIYEVAISYDGRTYDEGKKIGWRDGVRAMYCILRYSPLWPKRPSPAVNGLTSAVDHELAEALHNLEEAHNYADWIIEQLSPHLKGTVVELGAGSGTMTERIRRNADRTVATDLSADRVAELQQRFRDLEDVDIVQGDAASVLEGRDADSVVMINVLEHLEDDVSELTRIREALRPGGTVAIFVPAHRWLYSEFDRRVGHYRRYTKATLVTALSRAGLDLVDVRYVNQVGALAWWTVARTLRRAPTDRRMIRLYDRRLVPLLRRAEAMNEPAFGQSLIAVARKPL